MIAWQFETLINLMDRKRIFTEPSSGPGTADGAIIFLVFRSDTHPQRIVTTNHGRRHFQSPPGNDILPPVVIIWRWSVFRHFFTAVPPNADRIRTITDITNFTAADRCRGSSARLRFATAAVTPRFRCRRRSMIALLVFKRYCYILLQTS